MQFSSRLLLRVPPAFSDRLAEAARSHSIGKSEFTRRAIEREIAASSRKAARPEARL